MHHIAIFLLFEFNINDNSLCNLFKLYIKTINDTRVISEFSKT